MNQFYIFFSFHNWAILCLPSMKIHEQGPWRVLCCFHFSCKIHFPFCFELFIGFIFWVSSSIFNLFSCLLISCHQVLLSIPLLMGLFHPHYLGLVVYIYIFFCWKKKGTCNITYNRKTYMYMQHDLCMHQKVGKSHPHMDLQLKAYVGWIRDFSFICFFFFPGCHLNKSN